MTNMTQRIDAALNSALNEKRIVGAVIAVMKDGELAHFKPYGLANREQGKPMTEDAIFRLASISKPIVTAAASSWLASWTWSQLSWAPAGREPPAPGAGPRPAEAPFAR